MLYKKRILISIFAFLLILISFFVSTGIFNVAYASVVSDAISYSDVIDDLSKDENFNASDYVIDKTDKSLKVIQVAESINNELFVYVYQPSSPDEELNATTINISTGINENLDFKNYKLILLNSSGCLYKYVVKDLELPITEMRYYEISSIYRKWNAKWDTFIEDENGNIINEIQFEVGKRFVFKTTADGVINDCQDIQTIKITDKYVGFVRYKENNAPTWLDEDSIDSHFVAFNTDKNIDFLMEADVYYVQQSISYIPASTDDGTFGEKIESYAYLNYTNEVSCSNSNFWGAIFGENTYSWNEIQTVSEFFDENNDLTNVYSCCLFNSTLVSNLTESGKADIEEMSWILRFAVTDYSEHTVYLSGIPGMVGGGPHPATEYEYSAVGDVSILRLKFRTDGVVYNLGVIDNKQTGDGIADNVETLTFEISDWLKLILFVLIFIVILFVFPIIKPIISFIVSILKTVFKLFIYIVTFGSVNLFKKSSKRRYRK